MRLSLVSVILLVACKDSPVPRPTAAETGIRDDIVAIEGGDFIGRGPNCDANAIAAPPNDERKLAQMSVKQSSAAFSIDRRVTSCDDFKKCYEAGVCLTRESCSSGDAIVELPSATTYCQWRGMHVVKVAEWQRAIRSTDGRLYPSGATWNPWVCGGTEDKICNLTSSDGVEYSIFDVLPELTSDVDCTKQGDEVMRASVMISASGPLLGTVWIRNDGRGRFRCAR